MPIAGTFGLLTQEAISGEIIAISPFRFSHAKIIS